MPIGGFELVGKDVITSDGRNVGTVTDLAIEAVGWKVRDLRVAIDKRIAEELGLQTRREGLSVFLATRYESDAIARALGGAEVNVTAFFTDGSGRAVAGGLGVASFASP